MLDRRVHSRPKLALRRLAMCLTASSMVLVGVACAPAPRAAKDPPASSGGQDIDVLSERIDCRRNTSGRVEVDRTCCKENFQAAGC